MEYCNTHRKDKSQLIISITTLLLKIYGLDNQYFSLIFSILTEIFTTSHSYNGEIVNGVISVKKELLGLIGWLYSSTFIVYVVNLIFAFLLVFFISKKVLQYKHRKENYISTYVYDVTKSNMINRYIYENCDIDRNNLNIGEISFTRHKMLNNNNSGYDLFDKLPNFNTKLNFKDKHFGVDGNIMLFKNHVDSSTRCGRCVDGRVPILKPYITMKLSLRNSEKPIMDYIEHIEEFMNSNSKNIKLKFVRLFCDGDSNNYNTHCVNFYNGKRHSTNDLKRKHIDTFFHINKGMLYNYMYKINYEPEFFEKYGQNPRANIILHGPTGSGKSTFIERIAKVLNRHIVSPDLTSIKKKDKMYSIIQNPYTGSEYLNPSQVIIVFEEFDIAVKRLYEREKITDGLKDKLNNYVTSSPEFRNVDNMIEEYSEDYDDNIKETINQYKDAKNMFMLRDLLDILQGTVNIEKTIIFATSNKFDEIKDFCPELFRHSRMTPVYFGYFKKEQLNSFLNYYFNKTVDDIGVELNDDEINVPTSKLIEIALSLNIQYPDDTEKRFEEFLKTITF